MREPKEEAPWQEQEYIGMISDVLIVAPIGASSMDMPTANRHIVVMIAFTASHQRQAVTFTLIISSEKQLGCIARG